jgi:hypothetical protein
MFRAANLCLTSILQLALEHRRERNVQSFADLEQTRCADAVSATLILLNLLKREPNFSPRLSWVMLSARRPSRIRAPIYWSTALEALGDFVLRFAFFIWPLALDQLEVAIAFGGDVL